MTVFAVALLEDAARVGVVVHADGGRLVAEPKGALPAALEQEFRKHRVDVLALLATAVLPPSSPCWTCHGLRFFARVERLIWVCSRCHPPGDPSAVVWHDVSAVTAGTVVNFSAKSGGSGA